MGFKGTAREWNERYPPGMEVLWHKAGGEVVQTTTIQQARTFVPSGTNTATHGVRLAGDPGNAMGVNLRSLDPIEDADEFQHMFEDEPTAIDNWNRLYPVGTDVEVEPLAGSEYRGWTCSVAWDDNGIPRVAVARSSRIIRNEILGHIRPDLAMIRAKRERFGALTKVTDRAEFEDRFPEGTPVKYRNEVYSLVSNRPYGPNDQVAITRSDSMGSYLLDVPIGDLEVSESTTGIPPQTGELPSYPSTSDPDVLRACQNEWIRRVHQGSQPLDAAAAAEVRALEAREAEEIRPGRSPVSVRQSAARSQAARSKDEVARLAGELADLTLAGVARDDPKAKALAAAISGLLGRPLPETPKPGRILADGLVVNGIYYTSGFSVDTEWTYLGPVTGDLSKFRLVQRVKCPDGSEKMESRVDSMADHGLLPYGGGVWHPDRYVYSLGVAADSGKRFSEFNAKDSENLTLPEDEDEFLRT